MAFTASNIVKSVFGPTNVMVFRVTADAASGTLATGFNYIQSVIGISPRSCTTCGFRTFFNGDASSAACNGVIGFSGLVNGDVFDIAFVGR